MPRFDLFDRNRHVGFKVEIEKTSKSDGTNLLERVGRVSIVTLLVLFPHGVLKSGDTRRIVNVSFSSVSPVVFSSFGKSRREDGLSGRVSSFVKFESVEGEHFEGSSGNSRSGTCIREFVSLFAGYRIKWKRTYRRSTCR